MLITISTTCRNKTEARKISQALINDRLIACANFWPVSSIYRWQGKVVSETEMMLVCKTLSKNSTKVKNRIIKLHSYKVPGISIHKVDTNTSCLDWAKDVIN